MKAVITAGVIVVLISSLMAQTQPASRKGARKPVKPANAELQELKDAVAAQQQQIQTLQQQLQQTSQQLQQAAQQFQQTQQQLQQAQQTASDAQQKAVSLESSLASRESVEKLGSQFADVQSSLTNNALATQEDQKRVSALETTLGRFRWTGDVRIRGESFLQGYDGCAICNDRNRARVRVRFGFEGKLNDDFIAGIALATGSQGDPTTTNETLTNMFDRKTIALDRGFVTYNPVAHKWLSLTGGKFAFSWQRTSVTFDPDISPEGFVAKFSKDFDTVPVVKNLNIQFLQLLYNEVSGTSKSNLGVGGNGHDSFATGGQFGGRLQPTSFWTLTPSFTILNFRNPDAALNASAFAVQATSVSGTGTVKISGTTYTIPVTVTAPGEGPGCATIAGGNKAPVPADGSKGVIGGCAFAANGMTNSTYLDQFGNAHFLSGFLYADLILNNQFKTPIKKLPINLLLEYENNLNASDHPYDFTMTGKAPLQNGQPNPQAVVAKNLGKQSHAYLADFSVGQQKNRNDFQVGYAFEREEQDAIIASWGESDQRAPTNILQHRIYALWRVAPNTTASFTWWHGHTLNPFLQNAVLAPGMSVLTAGGKLGPGVLVPGQPDQHEPWLNRLQFDLIYTF